jgi:hypothetical protein
VHRLVRAAPVREAVSSSAPPSLKAASLPGGLLLFSVVNTRFVFPNRQTPVRRISEPRGRWDAAVVMQRTQEAQMQSKRTRELDRRSGDGLDVALLWQPETNRVSVSVFDAKTGDDFQLEVDAAEAIDAFHHPFPYAAARGIHLVPALPPTAAVAA